MARNTSRIVVGGGIAASVVAGATYGLANLMFSYALDAQAKHSMLRSGRDDGKVADKGPRLDAAEEVEAADWFDQSKQPVVISAEDGIQLHGWLFDPDCAGAKPHLYAICCHGYSGQPQDMAKYAHRFARLGFTVLVPALRGHGLSEGRYAGMGWLDRRDLMRWISLIIDSDADARILLQGKSMGAAAVMMTVGEPDLPRNVVAAVEDCGYASVGQQFIDWRAIDVSPAEVPRQADRDDDGGDRAAACRVRFPGSLVRGTAEACHDSDAVHPRRRGRFRAIQGFGRELRRLREHRPAETADSLGRSFHERQHGTGGVLEDGDEFRHPRVRTLTAASRPKPPCTPSS